MVNFKAIQDHFIAGALLGGTISLVLPPVIKWIVDTSGVSGITFATYNIRTALAGYAAAGNQFANFLLSYIGGGITLPSVLITALGIGAAAAAVRLIMDLLSINMNPKQRLFWVMTLASVGMGWVVSGNLPEMSLTPMIFLGVTGLLLAFVVEMVYKALKMPLPQ